MVGLSSAVNIWINHTSLKPAVCLSFTSSSIGRRTSFRPNLSFGVSTACLTVFAATTFCSYIIYIDDKNSDLPGEYTPDLFWKVNRKINIIVLFVQRPYYKYNEFVYSPLNHIQLTRQFVFTNSLPLKTSLQTFAFLQRASPYIISITCTWQCHPSNFLTITHSCSVNQITTNVIFYLSLGNDGGVRNNTRHLCSSFRC